MTRARVIGIVGGSGGVGTSALACAVAVRAATGDRQVLLVDGHRLGGGLDVLMGAEQEEGLRWPDLAAVRGRAEGTQLRQRLPSAEQVPVLSFDRSRDVTLEQEPVREVLSASCGAADVVVLDLPAPGDPLFEVLAGFVDLVVLVCGRGVAELAAASAKAALLGAFPSLWLCVRTTGRGLAFAEDVSEALGLPLLAVLRDDSSLEADLLHGIPAGARRRGPLGETADQLLAQLLEAPATSGPSQVAS